MKLTVDQALRKATTLATGGRKAEAEQIYREILARFPGNRRASDGLKSLQSPAPIDPVALVTRGDALQAEGRSTEALACYDEALRYRPQMLTAHNNRGNTLKAMGRMEEALAEFDTVIRLKPDIAITHFNRGLVLKELKRLEEALAAYAEAVRLKPDFPEAWLNHANVLRSIGRWNEALAGYDQALRYRPAYPDALNNRGCTLQSLRRYEEALVSFDEALRIAPNFALAHNTRANVLQELKRPAEAIAGYEAALRLEPNLTIARAQMHYEKSMICDWSSPIEDDDPAGWNFADGTVPPFCLLGLSDDPQLHWLVAKSGTDKHATLPGLLRLPAVAREGKLRIGYFSTDFQVHAVMHLIARVFELHDRDRFELHAFSFGPDQPDAMRRRVVNAFDHFYDIRSLGDREAAELARSKGIDVAIDLTGYTNGSRTNIFAYRAAPVQINYLGYPGTLGAEFMDYIIGDPIVIPPENHRFFTEKVITVPHCYQANDNTRPISDRQFTRAELGLPAEGFVFCCFNNNYKITPAAFDIWMRLLQRVEGSVLWLLAAKVEVVANLRREAAARGVDPDRLVLAPKMPQADHLARHRHADLFLDTFIYNAHTTASDALWTGLPIITKTGRSFPARVATSQLHAVGLPELVTDSFEAYEQLAFELATQPERLRAIKAKLAVNLPTAPMFDSEEFTRQLEKAYVLTHERAVAGQPPVAIAL